MVRLRLITCVIWGHLNHLNPCFWGSVLVRHLVVSRDNSSVLSSHFCLGWDLMSCSWLLIMNFTLKHIYFWLCQILVAACRIFTVVRGLICPMARGLLAPRRRIEPMFFALEGRFLTTRPLGEAYEFRPEWLLFCPLLRAILWTLGWSWPWCLHASSSLLFSVCHGLMLATLSLMTVDTSVSVVQMVSVLPGLCACVSSSYNAIKSTMKMTDIAILQWSFTVDIQWSLPRVSWHSLLLLPFQVTIAHTFFSSSEATVLSLGCSVGLLGPWDLSFTHTHLEFCRSTILLFETFQFFIPLSGF